MRHFTKTAKVILLVLAVVAVLALIIVSEQLQGCGYQICYSRYMLDNGYSFKNFQICGMKDKEMEKKVNESLNSCFYYLSDEWFGVGRTRLEKLIVHCQSARYLSVEYVWDYIPTVENGIYWHLCVTVDIENGKVVYLDDLVDINEEFVALIRNGSILRVCENNDFLRLTAEEVTQITNERIAEKETDYIRSCLMQFTRGYLYQNKNFKNYFYLEEDAICFKDPDSLGSVWQGPDIIKIMTGDIKKFLKVQDWTQMRFLRKRDTADSVSRDWMAYYSWKDIVFEKADPPYASEKIYRILNRAYAEIEFEGTFKKGKPEIYDYYKGKFRDFVENNLALIDKNTDEEMYLEEFLTMPYMLNEICDIYAYVYYFFDVDEDGMPELGIRITEYRWVFFKYDPELDKCFVWRQEDNGSAECFGGRKFAECYADGGEFRFNLLDSKGEEEVTAFFFSAQGKENAESLYIVMVPEYKDKKNAVAISKKMKEQGIYEKCSGKWYFRLTKEQFEELTRAYFEAEHLAQEKIQEVVYTYKELFVDSEDNIDS